MDPIPMLFLGAVLPAVAAAAVFLLARRMRRGREDAAAVGPAVAAGYVAGHLGLTGVPRIPPNEGWQWLLPIAVAAAALGLLDGAPRVPAWTRWTLRAALAFATAWVALIDRATLPLAGIAAAILFLERILDASARRNGARSSLAIVIVVSVAASVSLAVSGTMLLAQLGGALAAAAGACLLVGTRVPAATGGLAPVASVLVAGLVLNGVLFAELPAGSALLLAAAPAVAWIPLPAAWRSGSWRPAIARTAVVALVAAAGVTLAVANAPPLEY